MVLPDVPEQDRFAKPLSGAWAKVQGHATKVDIGWGASPSLNVGSFGKATLSQASKSDGELLHRERARPLRREQLSALVSRPAPPTTMWN